MLNKVMYARDVIAAVSIPRYWREHIRADEDLDANPVVLCPFHDDHHPSMRYNKDKKLCKCFSCGAGGDVIRIHMANKGIRDVQEAIEDLGRMYSVGTKILTLADVQREVDCSSEQLELSSLEYKAITIARQLNLPKVYCELDEIITQSDMPVDRISALKGFNGRHFKDGKLTP